MRKHSVLFYSILFCCNAILVSCGRNEANEVTADDHHHDEVENVMEFTPAQFKTAGIALGRVEQKQISGTIKVNGVLDVPPQQLISISAPLGGFLKDTKLLQGSRVKKGEVIATVENLEFIQIQQEYIEAQTQLELSKADYERQQVLARENVNSQKTLQRSKSDFVTWQAKYSGFREKLRVLHIDVREVEKGNLTSSVRLFSPINGYVTQVNVNIGKFVNPTDVLFEIVDTQHLHAELIVFEKDLPKLKIGQKVRFTLANESSERSAVVYLIGREINDDRTIRIHCHIDQEDPELLPGMYLSALVETGGATVSALPKESIIDYLGKKYIFIAAEEAAHVDELNVGKTKEVSHHFEMVEILTGDEEFGYVEVTLPDSLLNSEIVFKGAYSILSKIKNTDEGHGH